MAVKFTKQLIQRTIAEMRELGQLVEDPIETIYSPGDGVTRYLFKDGFKALGGKQALNHLIEVADLEHLGSFSPDAVRLGDRKDE